MEMAALGKGVISGVNVFKNTSSFDLLKARDGVIFCEDSTSLAENLTLLMASPTRLERHNNGAFNAWNRWPMIPIPWRPGWQTSWEGKADAPARPVILAERQPDSTAADTAEPCLAAGCTLEAGDHDTFRADCPVICIGNIMSGGTGKTPLAAAVAAAARTRGWQPVIRTRGYGGPRPLTVDTTTTATEAGDEALWLAQTCPVVIRP